MVADETSLPREAFALALRAVDDLRWPTNRLYPGYLAAAMLCALILAASTGRLRLLLGWLFPPGWTRGVRVDAQLFVANAVVFGLFLTSFVLTQKQVEASVFGWLSDTLDSPLRAGRAGAQVAYTIGMLVTYDLSRYVGHRLQHAIPALWELHKVHHSATTLTPLTLLRTHPLADLHIASLSALFTGAFSGTFRFAYPGIGELTVAEVNVALFASYLLANLRHSHVPLGFGRFLSHVFISPHQHQVHHSHLPQHIDKNFGVTLALWDLLFGTLYVARRDEPLELGLGPGELEVHSSLWDAYTRPIAGLVRMAGSALRPVRSLLPQCFQR